MVSDSMADSGRPSSKTFTDITSGTLLQSLFFVIFWLIVPVNAVSIAVVSATWILAAIRSLFVADDRLDVPAQPQMQNKSPRRKRSESETESSGDSEPEGRFHNVVYISRKGSSYHFDDRCSGLNLAKTKIEPFLLCKICKKSGQRRR